MKEIPLTRGMVALVDDADFEWLSQWKWQAMSSGSNFYASRDVRIGPRKENKRRRILMHREIVGAPDHLDVDHRNRATLDNQRHNLRAATRAQNMANHAGQTRRKAKTSKYRGVFWDKQPRRWKAAMIVARKKIHLGCFKSEDDAALAYNAAVLKHYGDFAFLNEVNGHV